MIPVDFYVDFESGNPGDALSTGYLDSVTRGTGVNGWTTAVSAPTAFTVTTAGSGTLVEPILIRDPEETETGSGDTRGVSIDMEQNDEAYYSLPFTASHDTISASLELTFTVAHGTFGSYDLWSIVGGAQALVCHVDTDDYFQLHTGSPSSLTEETILQYDPTHRYKVTLRWDRNVGGQMTIRDMTTGTDYSGWSCNASNMGNVAATALRIGSESHGMSPVGFTRYDNIMGDFTTAAIPLGPGEADATARYGRLLENGDARLLENGDARQLEEEVPVARFARLLENGDSRLLENGDIRQLEEEDEGAVTAFPSHYYAQMSALAA